MHLLIVICIVISISACAPYFSSTPTEKPTAIPTETTKTVELSELSGYTIVYPIAFEQHIAEEIELLRDVLCEISGSQISVIPDTQEKTGKEIVIVGALRETAVDEEIKLLNDKMDYVIATDGRDIIIGGLYQYADVRAIYDFIENYLGYDIDTGELSSPLKKISDCTVVDYNEPSFDIVAVNFYANAITNEKDIAAIADAGFNCIIVDESRYDAELMRKLIIWCTLYEINIIFRGMSLIEVYYDCPVVKGHCIVNDVFGSESYEYYSGLCDTYVSLYTELGWKPYINLLGQYNVLREITKNDNYFDSVGIISFNYKMWRNEIKNDHLIIYEVVAEDAREEGKEYWSFIDSTQVSAVDTEKTFHWMAYMGLCFGASGIQYFNYASAADIENINYTDSIVSADYVKTDAWEDAKAVNEEIKLFLDVYSQYEHCGAYVARDQILYSYTGLSSPEIDIMRKISFVEYNDTEYLVGHMKNESGYAFIILDLELPSDASYRPDTESVKIRINNGGTVTCYHNGQVEKITPDENGIYTIPIANSQGVFITVEN